MIHDLRERMNRRRVTFSVPANDSGHFVRCPACDSVIDYRKLGDVFLHEALCPGLANDGDTR